MGICPVTGNECNKPVSFIVTEQLGDKAQSTSCCRDCVSLHVQQRNTLVLSKQLEHPQPLTASDFVTKVFAFAGKEPPQGVVKTCPTCKINLDQILAKGILGCTDCYATFHEELKPYIDRSGGGQHKGKTPTGAKLAALSKEEQITVLERTMQAAIDQENYEQASQFRDLIKRLKEDSPPATD